MRNVRKIIAAAVALVACACTDPAIPSRDAPYEFRRNGEVFRWPADRLPVRYYVGNSVVERGYVETALRLWEDQFLYGEFRGTVVMDSALADVFVDIVGEPPPDLPVAGAVPPVGLCDQASTLIPSVDFEGRLTDVVRVELRWPAVPGADAANCIALQVAHELGHTLGILAESDGDQDLMNTNPRTRLPSLRDRATVQTLYQTTATWLPAERQ